MPAPSGTISFGGSGWGAPEVGPSSTAWEHGDPMGAALYALGIGKPPTFDPMSSQLANMSYSNWQQAANLMYPAQSQLIQYAEDPNYVANQRANAISGADASFNAQAGARARLMALQGISPTAAQSAALNKQDALAKAQAEAGAGNQAAQAAGALQNAVLQGI
jgi:hypothetical protein